MNGVYQKMLLDEYKIAFVNRLENKFSVADELRESIVNYIKNSKFDNDIERLRAADYFFAS